MAPFWELAHAHHYLVAGLVAVALLCLTKVACTFLRIFHSPPVNTTNNIHHHHHHEADDEPEVDEAEPEADEAEPEEEEEFEDPEEDDEPRPTLSEPVKQEVPVRRRSRFERIRSSRT